MTSLNSLAAARIAVDALIDGGVQFVVVSPGSRSAPMAYALAEAEAAGYHAARSRGSSDSSAGGVVSLAGRLVVPDAVDARKAHRDA